MTSYASEGSQVPYPPGSLEFDVWREGYAAAEADLAEAKHTNEDAVKFAEYVKAFEEAFGQPVGSSRMADLLGELSDQYSIDLFRKALDESLRQGKRSLAYAEGILKRWAVEGPGPRKPDMDKGRDEYTFV